MSFFYHNETSLGATSSCSPLPSPCGFLWSENIHPLCSHSLNTGILWWGAPEPSLLQGEKIKLLFPQRTVSPALWSHLWPSFELSVHVFLQLWWPELDTVLQVWPNKYCVEWDDHISSISANSIPADEAQDSICFSCCSSALLTHIRSGQTDLSRSRNKNLGVCHSPDIHWTVKHRYCLMLAWEERWVTGQFLIGGACWALRHWRDTAGTLLQVLPGLSKSS